MQITREDLNRYFEAQKIKLQLVNKKGKTKQYGFYKKLQGWI